jgi:NADH-quinone oxidoreductase subunit D
MAELRTIEKDYNTLLTDKLRLNVGPQHPSTHGVLRLEVVLDGEIVVDVIPHIGYLHRCFEKYAENMTYPQVIPYIDRMDYVCSMNNEWPYVMGMEKLLGIKVPERVEYIRVIMAELNRIVNHQVAIGTFGLDSGAFTPFLYLFRDREMILSIFEKTCGGRLLYNYFWIGGLSHDVFPTFKEDCLEVIKQVKKTNKEICDLLIYNKIFVERNANIGILPIDVGINFGISGPMLRASGIKWDLRRADSYSIYDRFDFDIEIGKGEVGTVGDCWDRNIVKIREIEQSCKIIEQAVKQIPDGDVASAIPKRVKPPIGEVYSRAEGPKGEIGFYIVSDGGLKPYRVKGRGPSFVNLSVLPEISKGYMFADLILILGSIDIVLGEIDR